MKKIEFESEIFTLIKKGIDLSQTTLKFILWHDCDNTIFINVELYNNDYHVLIPNITQDFHTREYEALSDNETNLITLKIEQMKIKNKVVKWLNPLWKIKIEVLEENV